MKTFQSKIGSGLIVAVMAAVAAVPANAIAAEVSIIRDVELGRGRVLRGKVLSSNGALQRIAVAVVQNGKVIATSETDQPYFPHLRIPFPINLKRASIATAVACRTPCFQALFCCFRLVDLKLVLTCMLDIPTTDTGQHQCHLKRGGQQIAALGGLPPSHRKALATLAVEQQTTFGKELRTPKNRSK